MTRDYLRVTPTSARINPNVISSAVASLHKLSSNNSDAIFARLNPFRGRRPVTFEFVAISEGEGEIVELWEPSTHSIQQAGLVADDTGKIKFTIWRKCRQPVVRAGQRVRFRAAKTNWYQGRCSIALTYHSRIEFPDREPWWET